LETRVRVLPRPAQEVDAEVALRGGKAAYLRFSQHFARLAARLAAKMDSDFLPGRTLHSEQHAVYPAHFRYPTY
jgi:hypothetical protein